MKYTAGYLVIIFSTVLSLYSCDTRRSDAKIAETTVSVMADTANHQPGIIAAAAVAGKKVSGLAVKRVTPRRVHRVLAPKMQVEEYRAPNIDSAGFIFEINGFGATSK